MCNHEKGGTQTILPKANLRTLSRDFPRVNTCMDDMEVLDSSDGELTSHGDDDVQESERIGEVGENENDGDGGESETSVCGGYARYGCVDDFCSYGGRSSGCRDVSGGEGDDSGDGGSSDGDDSDRGDGDSSDGSQRDWGSSDGDESDHGDGGDEGISNVLNGFLTRGGCCKHNCLIKSADLAQIRAHSLAALDKKTRKAVVLGMLALVQDNSGFHYHLDWSTPICKTAFCAVADITCRTLQRWKQEVCSGSDIVPNAHGNSGRAPHNALSQLDKLTVVKFIKNYAAAHALPDPGRLQGKTRDFLLESSHTMKSLYRDYCQAVLVEVESRRALPATQQPCPYRLTSQLRRQYTLLNVPTPDPVPPVPHMVSYPTFIRLWREYCLNIKIQASRSDLCDKCDKALVTLRHSLSDAQRKAINDSYNQHLSKAKELRENYNANIEVAEKVWRGKTQKEKDQILSHLKSRVQLSPLTSYAYLDLCMQYSFDYCQQVSLPYSSQQRGTFYFRTARKVHVFGVCCEPLCRQVFFLIDEAEHVGKGAVVVVSLVHAFFHLHGLGERNVTLQADNCTGQNKNTTMLWYMAWRVITGLHDRIQLNFMLPGHTKFRPDSYFGLFKKHYQRQDHIDDMADLVKCVCKSGQDVECVPQLYQNWLFYDWNVFLGQWFEPLSAFGRSHTFEFDREHPGVMEMRAMPSDTNPTKVNMLRTGVKVEDIRNAFQHQLLPPVIKPKGLSLQRSQYLFEKVREYVHDPTKRDNVCPRPQGITEASSAGGTSLQSGDSELPGSSATIPNTPTDGEVHVLMPENSGAGNGGSGSLKRKRRTRSELIYAFKCSVCGNEYASYNALFLHRKRNHTMPPVTGDGSGGGTSGVTGDALPVAVDSSHDEGEASQVRPKRKRRQLTEAERKFCCTECGLKYGSNAALCTHRKKNHSL